MLSGISDPPLPPLIDVFDDRYGVDVDRTSRASKAVVVAWRSIAVENSNGIDNDDDNVDDDDDIEEEEEEETVSLSE